MKKKAFTLIELIVVMAIIGVILAILIPLILPHISLNPREKVYLVCGIIIVLIIGASIFSIKGLELESNQGIIVCIGAIIALAITVFVGYKMLDTTVASGVIKAITWERKLVVSTSDESTREIITAGDYKDEVFWGTNQLKKDEYVAYKKEYYYFTIWDGEKLTEYTVSYDMWKSYKVGDSIEFDYQQAEKYITNIY